MVLFQHTADTNPFPVVATCCTFRLCDLYYSTIETPSQDRSEQIVSDNFVYNLPERNGRIVSLVGLSRNLALTYYQVLSKEFIVRSSVVVVCQWIRWGDLRLRSPWDRSWFAVCLSS